MYCIQHCILRNMQHLNIVNVVAWPHYTNLFNLVSGVQNISHFEPILCTTWSLSAWMAISCSFCLLCNCSFSSATFWNHTQAGRFNAFLVWQWWMQRCVYGPLISADVPQCQSLILKHWLQSLAHSQGFANVYHHTPLVPIHRSPCEMCNKWASILGNLAGWTWADLTWLAAIKSVCNFCTRRFMDLSSSSFLCWISSILVL